MLANGLTEVLAGVTGFKAFVCQAKNLMAPPRSGGVGGGADT